ncbi:hypothetical protein SteCoe_24960 [Stentor coeruleus]|uniref:Uncharacterized protein n=1 Tax=Stentor coeruleus TaxID=5963 RepID=A0A1R2BGD0_9CILI|nr:hypothetical protein SteCoe_24960 [Stentor coeruleus]
MEDSKRIAKLALLLNSAVRTHTANAVNKKEACSRALNYFENSRLGEKRQYKILENKDVRNQRYESMENTKKSHKKIIEKSVNSKSFNDGIELERPSNPKIIVKRRMKWKDYLRLQVEKQRKINQSFEKTSKIEEPSRDNKMNEKSINFKPNLDIKQFEKDLKNFKTVEIKDNFKKLDENECFFDNADKNDKENPENNQNDKEKDIESDIENEQENLEIDEQDNQYQNEDKRIQEIIERYTKTMGKAKLKEMVEGNDNGSIKKNSDNCEKRPKSANSLYSTISKKDAAYKIRFLELEEARIKKEKEDLARFLESRSQVREPSKRTTVASLMSKKEAAKTDQSQTFSPYIPIKPILPNINTSKNDRESSIAFKHESALPRKKKDQDTRIKDLINSLF